MWGHREHAILASSGAILDLGVDFRSGQRVDSLKALLAEGWDAIFVGSGAPRGRDLDIPGRTEAAANVHIGIDWLSSVSFGHINKIGKRVVVLGGGNTAMDCCRSSRRLGGEEVTVVVRSGFEEMKASPWEKEDAMHEGIPILNFLVPKQFTHDNGRLTGVVFEKVKAEYDAKGRRNFVPSGEPDRHIPCDDVLVAVGQENSFPGSSAISASRSTNGACPRWTPGPWLRPTPRSSSVATPRSAPRTSSGRWRTAIAILVALALLRGPVLFQSPLFSCVVRGLISFSPVLAPFGVLIFSALVLRSLSGRLTISIRLSPTGAFPA